MKFLADMGVSPRSAEWLRTQGYDAIHLSEQGLHELSDCDVLRKAQSEERVLLTMDLDFSRILFSVEANDLPITVIFRLSDQRPQSIQAVLETVIPIIERFVEKGNAILSVSDKKVRIRHLPVNPER